jgi:hypothetical protein
MISKQDFKSFINFSFAAIFIFAGHYAILYYFSRYFYAPDVLFVHPFLFVITFATIVAVRVILKKTKQNMLGNAYLATSLVKMFFAVLFLLPQLLNNSFTRKEYVMQFFLIYFIYLTIEVVYLVQQFKNSK